MLASLLFIELFGEPIKLFAHSGLGRVNALGLLRRFTGALISAHLSVVQLRNRRTTLLHRLPFSIQCVLLPEELLAGQLARRKYALADVLGVVLNSLIQVLSENDGLLGNDIAIVIPKHWIE